MYRAPLVRGGILHFYSLAAISSTASPQRANLLRMADSFQNVKGFLLECANDDLSEQIRFHIPDKLAAASRKLAKHTVNPLFAPVPIILL